jgi:hypothetical protein
MRADFPGRMAEQIESRTVSSFRRTTNEEADDDKGDSDNRRCAVKIKRERQWKIMALAKAMSTCRSGERASCRLRDKKPNRAGYAAPSVCASAAELRPGQWVPRECDRRLTVPGVPEPGTFPSRVP